MITDTTRPSSSNSWSPSASRSRCAAARAVKGRRRRGLRARAVGVRRISAASPRPACHGWSGGTSGSIRWRAWCRCRPAPRQRSAPRRADPPPAGHAAAGGRVHPVEHLKSFAGILQADIYAGYNPLYEAGRSPGPVTEAACWAHSRRKFFELAEIAARKWRGKDPPAVSPLALEAVKRIDLLFDIERGIVGKSATERRAVRQELSAPVLADLKEWMRADVQTELLPCVE